MASLLVLCINSGLNTHVDIPDKEIICNFDARRMRRAISNLLFNAISYCGGKGDMLIQLKEKEKSIQITFSNSVNHSSRKSEVEHQTMLKQPHDNEYYHVGLGLSIVKKIILLHGGEVMINEESEGRFQIQFTLPKIS